MKEPGLHDSDGSVVPLSSASTEDLRGIVDGSIPAMPVEGDSDVDFGRRYAAILLRERGAV
jgi:hypothetical protein